jgi:hypothetical protein
MLTNRRCVLNATLVPKRIQSTLSYQLSIITYQKNRQIRQSVLITDSLMENFFFNFLLVVELESGRTIQSVSNLSCEWGH